MAGNKGAARSAGSCSRPCCARSKRASPIARAVRTLLGDLAGPVLPGPAEVLVTVLRRGANQSNVRADLRQNGEILAFASAVLSTPRKVGIPGFRPRIEPPPAPETGLALPAGAPGTPVFLRHFEQRVTGPLPWSGAKSPEAAGWIRTREPVSVVDAPLLIAYLDSYWPAFFAVADGPRPMATISFTAEILCAPSELDPDRPLFYRARTIADHEGFQLEERNHFDAEGNLVAANQQTFCVIK
jgi:acyl-CoA thioesterase